MGRKDFFIWQQKANLIMTNDIQVTAREIDFVTRFERNWQHLRDILGIMRPIKKQPGAVLKSKYAEGTFTEREKWQRVRKSLTANSL